MRFSAFKFRPLRRTASWHRLVLKVLLQAFACKRRNYRELFSGRALRWEMPARFEISAEFLVEKSEMAVAAGAG